MPHYTKYHLNKIRIKKVILIKKEILYAMFFFLMVGFDRFYFYAGFAIKPFILITMLGIFVLLFLKRSIAPLLNFEKCMLLFWSIYIVSCIRFDNLSNGIRYICGAVLVIGFYFCVRSVLDNISLLELERIISLSGLIICIASLLSYAWGMYKIHFQFAGILRMRAGGILIDHGIPRMFGVLNNDPNIAALMLMLYFIYYFYHLKGWSNYIGVFLSGLCILLTLSRSALFSCIFAIIVGRFIPYFKREPVHFSVCKLLFPMGIVLILVYLKYRGIDVFSMILTRIKLLMTDKGTGRFILWDLGIKGWLENPIVGIGGNATKGYLVSKWGREQVLHNSWLEILLETGTVGAFPCVLFLVGVFRSSCKIAYKQKERYLVVLFIAMAIMMCSISVQFNEGFYLVLAIIYRYAKQQKGNERNVQNGAIN